MTTTAQCPQRRARPLGLWAGLEVWRQAVDINPSICAGLLGAARQSVCSKLPQSYLGAIASQRIAAARTRRRASRMVSEALGSA